MYMYMQVPTVKLRESVPVGLWVQTQALEYAGVETHEVCWRYICTETNDTAIQVKL